MTGTETSPAPTFTPLVGLAGAANAPVCDGDVCEIPSA